MSVTCGLRDGRSAKGGGREEVPTRPARSQQFNFESCSLVHEGCSFICDRDTIVDNGGLGGARIPL